MTGRVDILWRIFEKSAKKLKLTKVQRSILNQRIVLSCYMYIDEFENVQSDFIKNLICNKTRHYSQNGEKRKSSEVILAINDVEYT